jgi:hypothetical protein
LIHYNSVPQIINTLVDKLWYCPRLSHWGNSDP